MAEKLLCRTQSLTPIDRNKCLCRLVYSYKLKNKIAVLHLHVCILFLKEYFNFTCLIYIKHRLDRLKPEVFDFLYEVFRAHVRLTIDINIKKNCLFILIIILFQGKEKIKIRNQIRYIHVFLRSSLNTKQYIQLKNTPQNYDNLYFKKIV